MGIQHNKQFEPVDNILKYLNSILKNKSIKKPEKSLILHFNYI